MYEMRKPTLGSTLASHLVASLLVKQSCGSHKPAPATCMHDDSSSNSSPPTVPTLTPTHRHTVACKDRKKHFTNFVNGERSAESGWQAH